MKTGYNKEARCQMVVPETPLEAVEHLEEFFEVDMWYAKDNEWKTEEDMDKYLKVHFKVCKDEIKRLVKKR